MRSTFGTISLFQNSSVVRSIARCSPVKSSGVKIASGAVSCSRNPPPGTVAAAVVVVAILASGMLIQGFKNTGRALSAADAHRNHSIFHAPSPHLTQNRSRQLCAGAAERMSERNRAAVHIHALEIQPAFANHRERLYGEGFVQFDQSDIVELHAGERESFGNCHHWADAHNFGRHAAHGKAYKPRHWFQA